MPYIKNSTETVQSITTSIENAAAGFSITSVSLKAADRTEVETDCSETYAAGVKIVEEFKTHLNNAVTFINQVSTKLEEADEKMAIGNWSTLNTFSKLDLPLGGYPLGDQPPVDHDLKK